MNNIELRRRITQGVLDRRRARAARVVNPRILRAARLARLGPNIVRTAAAAGALALAPEAALAAAAAAVAGGAYLAGKKLKQRHAKKALLTLPPGSDNTAKPQKPIVVVPEAPTKQEPLPMAPKTGKNTAGRKKMWVPKFNPVSSISKAPVAIGNTIRGVNTTTRVTKMGQACVGRDFMFTPIAPGAVANWTMVGACPLSPTAFADSNIRQYAQVYNKFRFLSFTAHFITSSPTSTNGDVMFYYAKNRESAYLNQTSVNLLPFVMSDPNAVLGPQWQNMSATFDVNTSWLSLDYGMEDSPKDYAAGELFLLTKTSNTESPGYVIFDYEIEFGERSIQPRLLSLPITREIYTQTGLGVVGGNTTINAPYALTIGGNNISGSASAWPVGILDGDIYKVILDRTNSTFIAGSNNILNSLYGHEVAGSTGTIVYSDGFTCYAVYNANVGGIYLYLNAAAAYAGSPNRIFWASNTGAINVTIQLWMSYVGSTNYTLANISNI